MQDLITKAFWALLTGIALLLLLLLSPIWVPVLIVREYVWPWLLGRRRSKKMASDLEVDL